MHEANGKKQKNSIYRVFKLNGPFRARITKGSFEREGEIVWRKWGVYCTGCTHKKQLLTLESAYTNVLVDHII